MKSKAILCGVATAVVSQLGVHAASAQTTDYHDTGSETNVTLNPGTYIITAYGAAGGPAMIGNKFGGLGAEMSAEFNFSSPTDLTLLVGNLGLFEPNESEQGISEAGGGGGGSFVVEGSTPLVVAGGGGGGAIYGLNGSAPNIADGGNASITPYGGTGGGNDGGSGGTGGSGGNGGGYLLYGGGVATDASGAGGGGGFNTDGGYGNATYGGAYPIGGSSFEDGGAGGSGAGLDGPNNGGFGGGGGAYTNANDAFGGGGGGYSGGGGGGVDLPSDYFGAGGGGGSFIDSSAIAILAEVSGINSPDDGLKGEIIIASVLTWNNAGGSGDGLTWDAAQQNWNAGYAPTAYADGGDVIFNDSNNGHYAVTLSTTVAPASIVVDNSAGNYTISGTGSIGGTGSLGKTGTGTLTLSTANTYSGGTTISAGKLIVGVNGAVPDGAVSISGGMLQLGPSTGLAQVSSLSISGNGTLDITNNHMFIDYGSGPDPITSIAAYIKSGYNGGAWNGPGIISSTAQTPTNGLLYGVGYADGADGVVAGLSSGQIEVMYTLLGDANLDGLVNGSDFNILAANFNQSVTGWDQGDFNYDGLVNGADFLDLAANFNQGVSGAPSAGDVAALDAFAAADGLPVPTFANVPEPMSSGMIVMAGLVVLCRRRRSSHRVGSR
jgi:autotransporter-associated beta strand protein